MNAATAALPDANTYRWRRRKRILRALLLAFGSGGVLWWRTARVVLDVARRAPAVVPPTGAVLVPGYRLMVDELQPPYALRLRRALQLWQRQPRTPLAISGASFAPDALSEAQAGMLFLRDQGLPAAAALVLDHDARDTEENLLRAAALLGRPADGITVVTNRWHLARCAWLAARIGLHVRLAAAESHWRDSTFARLAVAREALSLLSFAGSAAAGLDPDRLLDPRR